MSNMSDIIKYTNPLLSALSVLKVSSPLFLYLYSYPLQSISLYILSHSSPCDQSLPDLSLSLSLSIYLSIYLSISFSLPLSLFLSPSLCLTVYLFSLSLSLSPSLFPFPIPHSLSLSTSCIHGESRRYRQYKTNGASDAHVDLDFQVIL